MNAVAEITPPGTSVQPHQERDTAITPMEMINRAMELGNIDMVERLMGMQERWEAKQARKAFDKAIAEAKAEIKPVVRNATGHNDKRYADFAAIARAVDPIISSHGLSYRFRTTQTDCISVTCILSHRDGHSEETTLSGPPDTSGGKNPIQSIGSTLAYLQRYSLVQALGLAAANDDDGRAAGKTDVEIAIPDDVEAIREKLRLINLDELTLCERYGIRSLDDLPASKVDAAMAGLEEFARRRAARQQEQSHG